MHAIIHRAELLLQHAPHPTLDLDELTIILRRDVDQTLDADRLRTMLGQHPDRFRILESWQGGWRHLATGASATTWVVAVGPAGPPPGLPAPLFRLRESVRWLGCGIDGRSRTDTSRWYAIAMTERATREAFVRRAA